MVHLRSEWSDDPRPLSRAGQHVGAAVIHHTVGTYTGGDKAAWLRNLEHMVTNHPAPGNTSALSAIDYNELIFPDGDVWEGRGFQYEDAATLHYNGQSVSWALIGNYEAGEVPDAMIAALAGRIRAAISDNWLKALPIIEGHRDVGTFATACPGRYAEARISEVRNLVATGGAPQGDDLTPEQATQLQALYDALVTDPASKKPRALADQLGWIGNWIKDGGYGARTDGKPSRIEAITAGVAAIKAKLGA